MLDQVLQHFKIKPQYNLNIRKVRQNLLHVKRSLPDKVIIVDNLTPIPTLLSHLDYLPFVYLMSNSYIVLTDSDVFQEETPGLNKPILVMRDTTERTEVLKAGTGKLVRTNKQKIIGEVSKLIKEQSISIK